MHLKVEDKCLAASFKNFKANPNPEKSGASTILDPCKMGVVPNLIGI